MISRIPGRVVAWALAAVAGAEALLAVGGALLQRISIDDAVGTYLVTNSAMGIGFAACGGILAVQRPRNPIGWLLLAAGLAHLTTAAAGTAMSYTVSQDWPQWTVRGLFSVFLAAWPWGICMFLPLALQLFPSGRPFTKRWRWLLVVTVVAGILFAVAMAAEPTPMIVAGQEIHSYVAIADYGSLQPLWFVANMAPLAGFVGGITSLIIRYRRGGDQTRRQLLWLVLAAIVAIGLNAQRWFVGDGPILLLLAISLVPIAVTIAILRHQLLDIRLVVSRALLYLLLTAGVIGAYLGLVAFLDAILRAAGAPLLATLLIALAFNPVRVWLQRLVDRLLYGSRADPVGAVSQVGARLAADDLAGVLEGIRQALRLPFAALRRAGRELTASGEPPDAVHTVALSFHGSRVGDLMVGVRPGERALGSADLAVLELLAAPLAAALHASALAEEVQASRERIVAAREEERRRLHRDLHDGLGPALTGAGFKADAAHNLLPASPQKAAPLLAELRTDIRAAIDDVRGIVYGLRPPALDELGLTGALRRYCEALPLTVTLELPEALPALPAAVEVAAYRIATEALTNVTRHAQAATAHVSLTVNSAVELSILDNGQTGTKWVPGVGITSIRERAAELGGTCVAGPTAAGGHVVAVLPLAVPS